MGENGGKDVIEYAGFWLRVAASLIDSIIFSGVSILITKLIPLPWIDEFLWILVGVTSIWFVSSKYQGTPGKIILKIKVTDLNGQRISFLKSAGRYCLYFVFMLLGFLCFMEVFVAAYVNKIGFVEILAIVIMFISGLVPFVGYIMVAFTKRKQGLHDKIFNTLVVKKKGNFSINAEQDSILWVKVDAAIGTEKRLVTVTRDSVCLGDDCESHELQVEIDDGITLKDLLEDLINQNYLASISGGKATWVLRHNNNLLAVVAQEWNTPKFLADENSDVVDLVRNHENKELFFEYLAQVDPEMIYMKLKKAVTEGRIINGKVRNYI